ncbi:MAG: efflux RND transporter permease subunit, partial [Candidatus Binataceae bacterium]
IKAPPGYSLQRMDEVVRQIEGRLWTLPETRHLLTLVGDTSGTGRVTDAQVITKLEPLGVRKRNQELVMADARRLLSGFPALRLSVEALKPWDQGFWRSVDLQYEVRGPDLDTLRSYTSRLQAELLKMPGVVDLDSTYEGGLPELQVHIDRQKASDLGVGVGEIARTMRTMVQGDVVTRYREDQETYDVRLQLKEDDRNNPEVIAGLTVPSARVGQVRLDNVASLVQGTGPAQIDRQSRQRQISLLFNAAPGVAMTDLMTAAGNKGAELRLPPGYTASFGGQTKFYREMVYGFTVAFVLSVIFMYMVLAAQFESFVHPITIMLSLPLAVPFALISLLIFGEHLAMFALLGILLLFGIVKKNSILQIDQTLNLVRAGLPKREAILTANRQRLRPILMTTAALVAGMIPVAVGTGAGAMSNRPIAIVVIGGQTLCLLITLLITPVAYSLFDDGEQWLRRRFRRPPQLRVVEPADEPHRHAVD